MRDVETQGHQMVSQTDSADVLASSLTLKIKCEFVHFFFSPVTITVIVPKIALVS